MKKQWIEGPELSEISREDVKEILDKYFASIVKGKKKVKKGEKPTFIHCIGAPGSGKSTYIKENYSDYVIIDFDELYRFHPDFEYFEKSEDVTGKVVKNVGFANMWAKLMKSIESNLSNMVVSYTYGLCKKRYNIVMHTYLTPTGYLDIKRKFGYIIHNILITATFQTCIQRSLERSINTGKFLGGSLYSQKFVIHNTIKHIYINIPIEIMFSDRIIVIDNEKKYKIIEDTELSNVDMERIYVQSEKVLRIFIEKTKNLHNNSPWEQILT